MKRVLTYGTFDLLHYGHINILRRAKELGDYLIVGLSTDNFNRVLKSKENYFDYKEREMMLDAIRYVDLVIPEENWEQKQDDIKLYKIDVFVMGDDWEGKFDYLSELCEVVYLPKTPEISSTMLRSDNLTAYENLTKSRKGETK
jgi:glycerol-3-phosphate cytidylyltransferase